MPREGSADQAQAHGVLMVQETQCRSQLLSGIFLPHTHSFTIFCCFSWWVRNSPDLGATLLREPSPAVVLNCRKAFLEGKAREAWDSRLRLLSLLLASCWRGCPLEAGASPPSRLIQRVHTAARCQEGTGATAGSWSYDAWVPARVAAAAAQPLAD